MTVLFCLDPLSPPAVEELFQKERRAAKEVGLPSYVLDFDALTHGDLTRALEWIPVAKTPQKIVYRGWMLSTSQYQALFSALKDIGWQLFNSPEQYARAHHLPRAYPFIEGFTPRSTWLSKEQGFSKSQLLKTVSSFGSDPLIIKDYVKSQKHYWREACFVPRADDGDHLQRVARRFLELQGESLAGGLVFREFLPLKRLGTHPKSGMPLSQEFRLFILNGEVISTLNYWDNVDYPESHADWAPLLDIAKTFDSQFFSMDLALTESGRWLIVELGDAQVSGFPDGADLASFYQAVAKALL